MVMNRIGSFAPRLGVVSILILGAVSLGGCGVGFHSHKPKSHKKSPIAQALNKSDKQIQSAWNQVSAVSQTKHPNSSDFLQGYQGKMPKALRRRISIQWAGPLDKVVRKMTHEAGWTYMPLGNKPADGITVFVNAKNKKIGDILENVGYQAKNRAAVVIKPHQKIVKLEYEH